MCVCLCVLVCLCVSVCVCVLVCVCVCAYVRRQPADRREGNSMGGVNELAGLTYMELTDVVIDRS